jgi:predicted  nucleic acid-binding Zn-ribbon protein
MSPEEADEIYRRLRCLPTPHPYEGLAATLSDALAMVDTQEQEIEDLEKKVAELENADLDALKGEVAELTQRLQAQNKAFRELYSAIPEAKTVAARKALQAKHLKDLSL